MIIEVRKGTEVRFKTNFAKRRVFALSVVLFYNKIIGNINIM